MKKLILALAAMLIAAPAAANIYDKPTKGFADSCSTFLRYTQKPPLDAAEFSEEDEIEAGKGCLHSVQEWIVDTGRFKSGVSDSEEGERADARCGAEIILRYNNDTPVFDALAAEFDTACGEPPAIM